MAHISQKEKEGLKVFLDDNRPAPEGWIRTYWPDEVYKLLETGRVTHLSLDNDLGDDNRGQGKDVIKWIEKKVFLENFNPPEIFVHSANVVAKADMMRGIEVIRKLVSGNIRELGWDCGVKITLK